MSSPNKFHKISEIIQDIREGKMVILVDDEDRENEGDIIVAADHINSEIINFMASKAKGLICLSLTGEQIRRLNLPLMIGDDNNESPNKTAFTVSVEASEGVTTGISAADRAHTIRIASRSVAKPKDITIPGHVFPIRAQEGGVLKRAGHTEASVDLARLAGLTPAAAICEIMNEDGTMSRVPELMAFAKQYDIKIGTIEDLIEYRIEHDTFVEELAEARLPSYMGEGFKVRVFKNKLDGREHIALVKGRLSPDEPILVRVQTENVLGDVFGGLHTRSREFLEYSIRKIDEAGAGVIVYLRAEDMPGRLVHRVKAYSQFDRGELNSDQLVSVFNSDKKDYGIGAQILRALGLKKIKLISNSPSKRVGLKGYGIEIVESVHLDGLDDVSLKEGKEIYVQGRIN